jgi:hypothetical protein
LNENENTNEYFEGWDKKMFSSKKLWYGMKQDGGGGRRRRRWFL